MSDKRVENILVEYDRNRNLYESFGMEVERLLKALSSLGSGIARLSVESSGSRVTHFTTPSSL
jgi:hypothetical protein